MRASIPASFWLGIKQGINGGEESGVEAEAWSKSQFIRFVGAESPLEAAMVPGGLHDWLYF